MSPVYVVLALALTARLLGTLGVIDIGSWVGAARLATGLTFIVMGAAHFTSIRHDVAKLVPSAIPRPALVVALLGIWQIVGGVGILVSPARRISAVALVVLLLLKLPANVRIAREALSLRGRLATAPSWRVPAQFLWIALVWWAAT